MMLCLLGVEEDSNNGNVVISGHDREDVIMIQISEIIIKEKGLLIFLFNIQK